jgi:predicted type IV restriction endonuclease
MRIQSPLSNISDVLAQIKDSAIRYQDTLKKNEAATRAVLIDPVLRTLGWDTANTYMVEVEKTLDQARVDYALYDNNSTVRVIIEAKSLNTNLAQPGFIMSLVNYAFTFQLQDIFLTDGIIWQHFTNFQPGNVKVERILDIVNDNPVDCGAYLVQRLDAAKFWPEEQTIDKLAQQVTQLESLVATLEQEVNNLKAGLASTASPGMPLVTSTRQAIIQNSPQQAPKVTYFELDQVTDITGKRPSQFRLPNGTEIKVKRWKDVLRESCKFALQSNLNIPIPFLDRSGKKVSLFSNVKPATGISYVTEDYNGQTIFIYVNYDANNCVANARYVLQQVPNHLVHTNAAVAIVQDDEAA